MTESPRRTRHDNPSATLALNWISADQHGASVLATARNLLAAEHEARRVLPLGIANVCRVARIEKQHLTLAVPSAAYASKLRQLGPRILAHLNKAGWNLNEITIRVQGTLAQNVTQPATRTVEPLGSVALTAFSQLHAELKPGPLASAIQRLLKHHA